MLLRVYLKNFLSFDEGVQFDMFPNMKRTTLAHHIMSVRDELPVLKMAAIYGANGAGKSNLLKGINFVKKFVTDKDFLRPSDLGKYFYALKADAGVQPIELMVEFVTNTGKAFIYAFQIAQTGVVFESLLISGLGIRDNETVFTRDASGVIFKNELSSEIGNLITGWMEKNPYSSLLTINKDMPVIPDPDIDMVRDWFDKELLIIGLHSFNPQLIAMFKENDHLRQFASEVFDRIDLGIGDIQVNTENFEDWLQTHEPGMLPVDKVKSMHEGVLSEVVDFRNTRSISVESGIQKISQFLFEQFGKDGYSRDMDIQAQSDGTVRLLSLIAPIYFAINGGKTIVIDEIDHSIHPSLVRGLIRYFSFKETNGQLIFSTHQTCLLNQEFLRTDEVWLVEKKEGASHMYSLNDFKIHNTINIENGYLEGRYGAIPFLGELNM